MWIKDQRPSGSKQIDEVCNGDGSTRDGSHHFAHSLIGKSDERACRMRRAFRTNTSLVCMI